MILNKFQVVEGEEMRVHASTSGLDVRFTCRIKRINVDDGFVDCDDVARARITLDGAPIELDFKLARLFVARSDSGWIVASCELVRDASRDPRAAPIKRAPVLDVSNFVWIGAPMNPPGQTHYFTYYHDHV